MPGFDQDTADRLNSEIATAHEALEWASENLHPRVAMASSFGAEDSALMDIMMKVNPDFRFFTLDTGRLPQATHDAIDAARRRYKADIKVLFPDSARVQRMVEERGQNLFYDSMENRKLCCRIRKVEPLNLMLDELDGWITGLRRDQTQARQEMAMFEVDESHGNMLKINPLIEWSWDDVWSHIREHDVPYNALLDNGYPSIGCEPCTRAVRPGEGIRAGRWWWEQGIKECGLHHGS